MRWLVLANAIVFFCAPAADALCGFYASDSDSRLINDASHVVLLREGTRTVVTLQANYRGPAADFSLIIPVPAAVQKQHVATLSPHIMARLDGFTAPRLLEFWEEDPCANVTDQPGAEENRPSLAATGETSSRASERKRKVKAKAKVKVKSAFTVGEYNITVLGAKNANALAQWLADNDYKVPAGANKHLQEYVASGALFLVAKVDASKLAMASDAKGKRAVLSPLRFHYDSETFSLPVRIGLINNFGAQDLIIHVIARNQRYELANYPNLVVPTELEVKAKTRDRFHGFYSALFDRVVAKHPGHVLTEFSGATDSCDSCPVPPMSAPELSALGVDVAFPQSYRGPRFTDWVVSRLHARYSARGIPADFTFKKAKALVGDARGAGNRFQARYLIRHGWPGPVTCAQPKRGRWGPPPSRPTAKPAATSHFATSSGKAELAQLLASPQQYPQLVDKDSIASDRSLAKSTASKKGGASGDSGCSAHGTATLIFIPVLLLKRRRS